MRYRSIIAISLIGLVAGLGSIPAAAQSDADGYLAYRARLATPEDVYYIFDAERKEVVSYKSDRVVRICVGDSEHAVPLKVYFDDKTVNVNANDCTRVEAKEVSVEPAKRLDSNQVLVARAQTLN